MGVVVVAAAEVEREREVASPVAVAEAVVLVVGQAIGNQTGSVQAGRTSREDIMDINL